MTAKDNLELLGRWNDAFESGGVEAAEPLVDEVFDPEVEFSPLLAREVEGRTLRGREELRAFFGELNEALEGMRYADTEFRPVGDDVVVMLSRLIGRGRGSSVEIGQELGAVYEFQDGLVRRMTAYGSHEEALAAAREAQRA
jgi:ketosteroid isomerase-like protein